MDEFTKRRYAKVAEEARQEKYSNALFALEAHMQKHPGGQLFPFMTDYFREHGFTKAERKDFSGKLALAFRMAHPPSPAS